MEYKAPRIVMVDERVRAGNGEVSHGLGRWRVTSPSLTSCIERPILDGACRTGMANAIAMVTAATHSTAILQGGRLARFKYRGPGPGSLADQLLSNSYTGIVHGA